ncbi:MAG: hypothetical protein ACK4GL_05455 [Flavobacteriales bacterium]
MKKLIFYAALAFIVLSFLSLTLAQVVPIEFAEADVKFAYYETIMQGLPIAILLTLFGTIRRNNKIAHNWAFVGLTVMVSIASFYMMVVLIFQLSFGSWIKVNTIYRHKSQTKEIQEQWFDIGALGYGGQRIVVIKPFLKYWIIPSNVDTTKLNKKEWEMVNEPGAIIFP